MVLLLHVALGFAVGLISGLFGITGGVIAVPMLSLLGLSQQVAQGTSLVMQLPTGVVALWHYTKRGAVSGRIIATLAIASGAATYLGARLAIHLREASLRKGFALFLLLLATFTLWNALAVVLRSLASPGRTRPRSEWVAASVPDYLALAVRPLLFRFSRCSSAF